MVAKYTSVIYDLTAFGIFKINNAIVNSDLDDGIAIEVSFDGGSSFSFIDVNKKFKVKNSNGKIQVRITFNESRNSNIYMVKTSGFFQNLDIGTTIFFTKNSNKFEYKTTVGRNGKYSIQLPRGTYSVWYIKPNGEKETLAYNLNPEITMGLSSRYDKDLSIENFFKDIPWAKNCVFDTFHDNTKMLRGTTIVDPDGDLSDGLTNRKCRYWAIGFD